MRPFKEQFTVRGVIIAAIGSAIISASSIYVALKLGALPWPIFFVALIALFVLKAFGNTNINEANVAATGMSAGAMVAGGIAFTIPGIYMLDPNANVSIWLILICALSGVIIGVIAVSMVRKHYIEDAQLPYPIGIGAAKTLEAGDKGGHKATILFSSMGFSAIWAALRDGFGKIPTLLLSGVNIPGVTFGIYASPMALAVGFLLGPIAILVWFIGAVLGDFGIVVGGSSLGLWDVATGQGIKQSLGIGVMIGCGVGILLKLLVPRTRDLLKGIKPEKGTSIVGMKWAPFAIAAIVLVLTFVAGFGLVPSLICVAATYLVVIMAAQCTGQAGLDPMEVFGIIVLALVAIFYNLGGIIPFLIASVAAVACGLVGDMMNDFKAGYILKSDPRAQWYSEVIGALVGAFVAVAVIALFTQAYGTDCFGVGKEFIAAQASVVASMVGGIPNLSAFLIGIAAGCILYLVGAPVITLGLGIYLPFYLSFTIAIGGLLRFIAERIWPSIKENQTGVIVASGLLGGESITGVVIALISVCVGLAAL